ncbi:AMP-binding protein [Candidatus Saccharibacteria bacterium]|nr:MAG: AMP-binding protein [Candidatus Saccharibacteria bacterium]
MVKLPKPQTIDELLHTHYAKWRDRPYIWSKNGDEFASKSFWDFIDDARALAASLIKDNHKGDNVMLFADNSYEWMVADMAVMAYVGISIGANKDWLTYDLLAAQQSAEAKVIIYSSNRSGMLEKLRTDYPDITYLCIENDFDTLLQQGRKILDQDASYLDNSIKQSADICKIVFTSGSTSIPKAVTLSLDNMLACGDYLYQRTPTNEHDIYYLFLPLHHVYAGVSIFMYSFYMGCQLYICSDTAKIVDEMKLIRPTIFCGVPLVYERFYSAIDAPTMAKIERGMKLANALGAIGIDIRRHLFRKLHDVFGGDIRYMYCGGARFDPKIKRFFKDVGMTVIEGYGMSETTSLIAVEYPHSKVIDSVGTIFENISVKFADVDKDGHGEILVKGGNVSKGYYNNPVANARAFDAEGYFHTGDIGYKDDKNNLFVIGRKKLLIVASNGENVSPDELETLLVAIPGVTRAKVFDHNNVITATLYVDKGCSTDFKSQIAKLNSTLPKYKQVQKWTTAVNNPDRMK